METGHAACCCAAEYQLRSGHADALWHNPPCASSFRTGRGDCSGVTVPGVEEREEAREMTEAILPSLVACHEGWGLGQARIRGEVMPGWTRHAPCRARGRVGKRNGSRP